MATRPLHRPRHHRRNRRLLPAIALTLSGALLAIGCGASGSDPPTSSPNEASTTPPPPQPRDTDARALGLQLVDSSRPTVARHWEGPTTDRRDLPTTVLLPPTTEPGPVVVFAHGLGSHPWDFLPLLQAWADAGNVVVAPTFPLTSSTNPNHNSEATDLPEQPADVSFVLDRILEANDDPRSPLFASMQADVVGMAGWSLGGATTYGTLFEPRYTDPRISAGIIMASADLLQTNEADYTRPIPTMVLHGDADEALPYRYGRWTFDEMQGPAQLLTLRGATHDPPYRAEPSQWDAVVTAATTGFWQATLGGDALGLERIDAAVEQAGDLVDREVRWFPPPDGPSPG